jgi:probable dihydroxyacetone kinase regulator
MEAVKGLMKATPLEKISIAMIVNACGLNRQTFYYHFQDKFAIVNAIFETEVVMRLEDRKCYQHWSDGLLQVLTHIANNHHFYKNAFQTPGENTFRTYFFSVVYSLIKGVIDELVDALEVDEKDRAFVGQFYTHAFVGLTVSWVLSGCQEAPEGMVHQIHDVVDGSMYSALMRFSIKKSASTG